jgi:hypothetical protein
MGELFIKLIRGEWFYFLQNKNRKLVKSDDSHYIGPTGRRKINPFTLVFREKIDRERVRLFGDKTEGDSNE